MSMLMIAIEEAGLNRALIRDALETRKKRIYRGVTGEIPLNDIYTDAGEIALAEMKNGQWMYMSEEEAGIHFPRIVEVE